MQAMLIQAPVEAIRWRVGKEDPWLCSAQFLLRPMQRHNPKGRQVLR